MRVLEEQPCGLITAFDRVLICVWSPIPSDVPAVTRLLQASQREAERQGKIAFIVALQHDAPMPSEPVRKTIQDGMRKMDPMVICGATIIDKAGFRGSALRAVLSTMQLISQPKHPEKVFASAAEGVVFVRAEIQRAGVQPPSVRDLVDTYEATKERAKLLGAARSTNEGRP